jgi:hypothetical protein
MAKIKKPIKRDTKAEERIWQQFKNAVPGFRPADRWQTNDATIGLDITSIWGDMVWLVCITPTFGWEEMVSYYVNTVRPLQYATKYQQANGLVIADSAAPEVIEYASELDMRLITRTPQGQFQVYGHALPSDFAELLKHPVI